MYFYLFCVSVIDVIFHIFSLQSDIHLQNYVVLLAKEVKLDVLFFRLVILNNP